MKLLLGPVLYAEDQAHPDAWTFSVNLLLRGTRASQPPPLRLAFRDVEVGAAVGTVTGPEAVADFTGLGEDFAYGGVLWKWRVSVPRGEVEQRLGYRFEATDAASGWSLEEVRDVVVPPKGALPHAAFFSCNGMSEERHWHRLEAPFALWDTLALQHRDEEGFHLLLGGGDQLYADTLWHTHPELSAFKRLCRAERLEARPAPGFERRMLREYVRLYCERWREDRGIGTLLERVPGLFTWDDHDIFDGWGSHEELQHTPYFRAVYHAAAVAFEAFQLGALRAPVDAVREPGATHYLQTARFSGTRCDVDVVLLDLRSGRTVRQRPGGKVEHVVLSAEQWAALEGWRREQVARAGKEPKQRHVVVLSSIPLVFMRFGPTVEWLAGARELRDDLLDQWESQVHRGERLRMLTYLFELGRDTRSAVTVVSGDMHVAAHGRVRSQNPRHLHPGHPVVAIEQVTSSGIVHPPPSTFELQAMRLLARESTEDLPASMQSELLPVGNELYLRERNWLSLWVTDGPEHSTPKLWLQWEAEHSHIPMRVVVEPPAVG